MLLGIFLRSPEVINHNPLFGYDQGRDYLVVRDLVVNHKLTLIGSEVGAGFAGIRGLFHGPYYYYLLTLPFIIFKGDPYGAVVLMFVSGVAALILAAVFLKRAFGLQTALVTLLLIDVALSAQSRFMWPSHLTTPLIILTFWLVYKIPQNPGKYFFPACFLAGLIYGFQLAISVSLIATLFLYLFLVLKIKNLKVYFQGLLGVIIAYLPFFLFETRHGFMALKSLGSLFGGIITGEGTLNWGKNFSEHFLGFWFNFRDTFLLGTGDLHRWLAVFLLLTIIIFWRQTKPSWAKNFLAFLLLLPPVTFLMFLPLGSMVWGNYLVHLHLVYIIIFAYLLAKVKPWPAKIIFLGFLILMLPNIGQEVLKAKADFSDDGGVAKLKGQKEAVDYLYWDAAGQPFNVLVFTPPVYDYEFRYFLLWYGEPKYHYLPGNEKKGLFYLWIEPDDKKPWTYKGWLETVIKTGKILKEEQLPSGFIMQKRVADD